MRVAVGALCGFGNISGRSSRPSTGSINRKTRIDRVGKDRLGGVKLGRHAGILSAAARIEKDNRAGRSSRRRR